MDSKQKILLHDAETNRLYSVYVTVEEMKPLETDLAFATQKLSEAQKSWPQESLIQDNNDNTANEDREDQCTTNTRSNYSNVEEEEHLCTANTRNYEEGGGVFKWPHEAILLLIEEYTYKQHDFTTGKQSQKKIWSLIASEMVEHGHNVTGPQCQSKFSGLKRTYKAIKDNNKNSGNGTRKWPYFEHMDNLLYSKPFMTPVKTLSSTGASTNSFTDAELSRESTSEDERPVLKKARQMSTLQKALHNLSEERRKSEEAMEMRHKENVELKRQLLLSFNKIRYY